MNKMELNQAGVSELGMRMSNQHEQVTEEADRKAWLFKDLSLRFS